MRKDKFSEVCSSGDADCDALGVENVVCEKSHLFAKQSDNSACTNDGVLTSSKSSANNFGYGTLDNASKDVKMILRSNARDMVIEDRPSSKVAQPSNVNLAFENNSEAGPNGNELVSAIATKSQKMDCLSSCTESEKMKSFGSAAVNLIDLDAANPLVGSKARASAQGQTGENDTEGQRSVDSHDLDEKSHQYDAPDHLIEDKKRPLVSSLESEDDDAELEEQDVKICDICGDAGRDDLLAICSRCSDGAEHTYCMQEKLDELPEGNWLCEECKSCDEMERQILSVKSRSRRNLDSSLEKKDNSVSASGADSDSSTKRLRNKRRASELEVDPIGKKQILESMVHSPNASTSAKDGGLSRDNSFKNVDKMNAKLTHQTSLSGKDSAEKPRSPNANLSNAAKGSYLKSNSFGTSSSAPKVKMAVEIPQKHKQGVDVKDASSKILSKSMSSKGSLSRSNTTESKVKMLSPKDSHVLESRGLPQAKDRNVFERKNSIKLDHSSASQLAVNGFKNQHRGEGRRQADVKSSLSLKEGGTSSLSRLDSEKNVDKSSNPSRQGAGDGSLQSGALDTCSVRSLKDGLNEENKLKAAIQAALQKRLDMSKNKGPDKSNLVSVSNVESVDGKATSIGQPEDASPSSSLNTVSRSKDSLDSFQARNIVSLSSDVEQIRRQRRCAIPEHEFAWIGSFEVCRGGTTSEQIFGIQAHLSTSASSKVLEMVKKFPQKVHLSEVPRSHTWPVQFQDGGAEEDDIAVYFFAKDVESYERCYKNLLEKLMKEDLALKGNIDGIDLLVFPSKQLMKRSQRWNMLSFIWGVFRGRKENCLDNKSGYVEKRDLCSLNTSKVVTSISTPEMPSSDGYARENVSSNRCDQDINCHSVLESGTELAKDGLRYSNGNHGLDGHSLHNSYSSGMKSFGHQKSRNESEITCGRRSKSTLVVENSDPENTACKGDSSDERENKTVGEGKLKDECGCGMELKRAGNLKKEEDEKIELGGSNSGCPSTEGHKRPLTDSNFESSTSTEKRYDCVAAEEKLPEAGRLLFPINSKDDSCSSSSTAAAAASLEPSRPNLELALGVENRTESGLFLGLADDHRNVGQNLGLRKEDEEERIAAAAALSLSLALTREFPEN